jgi:phosphomevalonate kinase
MDKLLIFLLFLLTIKVNSDEKTIIFISGYARSGKDTVANTIIDLYGKNRCVQLAFADTIKEMASNIYQLNIKFFHYPYKDQYIPQIYGTPRDLLIQLGYSKRNQDPFYWAKIVGTKIKNQPGKIYIISDMRYQNEYKYFKIRFPMWKMITFRISRQSENSNDGSDPLITKMKFDHYIKNDGTLKDLRDKIKDVLDKHLHTTYIR